MTNETTTVPAIKVGDIFNMSWGYDQTNVNWFQVTRLSKAGIFVREIASRSVPGTDGFMSDKVVPVKDCFLDRSQWCGEGNPETFRKVKPGRYTGFNFEGRYFAHLSDGSASYRSWYA
jgi:hypothetical protein